MYKKVLILTIFMSVLLSSTVIAKEQVPKDKPGSAIFVMSIPTQIKVETKNIRYANEYVNIDMKLPQIEGLSSKKFENVLNKYFKIHATNLKKSFIQQSKEYNNQSKEIGIPPMIFELITTYSIKESTSNHFTLGVFEYTYTGGAHGIGNQKYINIDLRNNKILTLKDLFLEDADYKKIIENTIQKQISDRKKQGEYFLQVTQGLPPLSDEQVFYMNSKGDLVIVFNVYEIAPYTSGVMEFVVPFNVLKPYLKPQI